MPLTVLQHPVIREKLTVLRDKNTDSSRFRRLLGEISALMVFEVTRDLPTVEHQVETPLGPHRGARCSDEVTLVPILRAGLGMADAILAILPRARVGHIGLYRDHDTLEPHFYYDKQPPSAPESQVFVLDPMLATGGSASAALTRLKEHGCKNLRLVCIVGAPEGVAVIRESHPDVHVFLAALDDKLNEQGYIVPGLGDAGDRIFGTH